VIPVPKNFGWGVLSWIIVMCRVSVKVSPSGLVYVNVSVLAPALKMPLLCGPAVKASGLMVKLPSAALVVSLVGEW
jgi:hypothetical protein